jgi:hypothetical protein
MRVRELLAANAFCLLALTSASCARVEQPVGEYTEHDRPARPDAEPPRPAGSRSQQEAGSGAAPIADGGLGTGMQDPPDVPEPDSGPATGPSTWLPPMLLDGGPTMMGDAACPISFEAPVRRRLDMYLMVDSNITVSATGVWEVMADGIGRFVSDPRSRGTGVGIRYFGNSCDLKEYSVPSVEVAALPNNATPIIISTRARRWSASPMLPALEGAIMHQKDRSKAFPEAKQVVALVSDGVSQDFTCLYSTQSLAEAARDALISVPSVETHVIAVGVNTTVSQPLDDLIARLGAFNAIADAGGSGQAVTTDITGDAIAFGEALQRLRRNASPCEFAAPNGAALGTFGVARGPVAQELKYVPNERSCGSQQAWYYAAESLPTPVTLCPATCQWLRDADDHEIGLFRGCMN